MNTSMARCWPILFLLLSGPWLVRAVPAVEPSPSLLNYEGTLADDTGAPLGGTFGLTFALYDHDTGGSPLWQETRSITVRDGRFQVLLGSTVPFPDQLFTAPRWLGLAVGDDPEQTPRHRIFTTAKPGDTRESRCPDDMVDLDEFCIDRHTITAGLTWYDAADYCDARGKRLCSMDEWFEACDGSPINGVDDLPGRQPQWVDRWVFETSTESFANVERGYFRCSSVSHPWSHYRPLERKWFRCCR